MALIVLIAVAIALNILTTFALPGLWFLATWPADFVLGWALSDAIHRRQVRRAGAAEARH